MGDDLYFGEKERKLVADGKHSLAKVVNGTVVRVYCKNPECNWQAIDLLYNLDAAEYRGWLHISKPNLRVLDSSDIWTPARMAAMRQDHPDLFLPERLHST